MATPASTRAPRISAARREEERVTPLELFFDLVFVLALAGCGSGDGESPGTESSADVPEAKQPLGSR